MKQENLVNKNGWEEKLSAEDGERWNLVQRIVSSESFARALQLREILLYVAQQSFIGPSQIKEQDIALNALGRRQDFDGTSDNIVRVQVGHLRKKLEQYFATEGQAEPLTLVIPKGGYLPRFERRTNVAPSPQDNPVQTPEISKATWGSKNWGIAAILFVCFILAGVGLYRAGQASSAAGQTRFSEVPGVENAVIHRIFAPGASVSIVTGDTNLVLLQNILHTNISANEYVAKGYPENILSRNSNAAARSLLDQMSYGRYTSYGDAKIAVRCSELARQYGSLIVMRYARYINIRDFEQGNFVLVGSRTANPWVSLFEPKLNFIFEEDPATHTFHFRNRTPTAGEQDVYLPSGNGYLPGQNESINYAHIALLPNLAATGYVLLLDGATMESTEAAAEFLFGKEYSQIVARSLGTRPLDNGRPVEILLRVSAIQGTADSVVVAAVHGVQK